MLLEYLLDNFNLSRTNLMNNHIANEIQFYIQLANSYLIELGTLFFVTKQIKVQH